MLRAVFLSCALVIPAFFTSAIAGQLDFRAENAVADNTQIPLDRPKDPHNNLRVCQFLSQHLLPEPQVFYQGAVFALFFKTISHHLYRSSGSSEFAEDIAHWANSSLQ